MGSRTALVACAVWLLCGAYTSRFITRGWIPHDEGTIGQSAERVLVGQLPHRDFDELYTGGLTYVHAAAMRVLGVNLVSPRLILFAAFMAFLAAAYQVATRVSSPSAAIAAMALITVWSVPNYFVSLPNWYTLFLSTFGIYALMRFLEAHHRGWLLIAGVCGGLSILTKITGAYYVVGALVFLIYVAQTSAVAAHGASRRSWFWVAAAIPVAFVGALLYQQPSWSASLSAGPLFVAPLAVCGFVLWTEWRQSNRGTAAPWKGLWDMIWPFGIGLAAVVIPYVIWYWRLAALPDLLNGVLIQPQRRLIDASISPPALVTFGLAAPYAALLLINERGALAKQWLIATVVAIGLGAVLLLGMRPTVYRATWVAIRSLPLVVALGGIVLLARRPAADQDTGAHARVFLLTSMAAMLSLVQFPYASPTYFFYCAPIAILALIAIVSAQRFPLVKVHIVGAAFVFLFAIVYTNRSYGWNLGVQFIPYAPTTRLNLERGGLVVSDDDARTYESLVDEIHRRAAGGAIYAAPDCPEVYFLLGFQNPSRALFEFLSRDPGDAEWMQSLLDRAEVRAVVVNTAPAESPPLAADVRALLERRFPVSRQIGRFVVRWDDTPVP